MDIKKAFNAKIDRRRMLGNLGMMGAGAVLTACGTSTNGQDEDNGNDGAAVDIAILNFALNLEYLEAAYYMAAVGRIGEVQAIGGDADIILPEGFDGTTSIDFQDDAVASYAAEIAQDEFNHVVALRAAIGEDDAVDRPELDLGPAFYAAAAAAFDMPEPVTAFNPFANDLFFMHGAYIFEDVGVTAYNGAAPLVTDKKVLASAAGILAVEAYHSGEVRTYLYNNRNIVVDELGGVTVAEITTAISNLRASVGNGRDQPIVGDDDEANIVVADENSIAFGRAPSEVLPIVYLGAEGMGGFFPQGVNGDFSALP